jgi:CRISPR/Cas system CSM-associated protein Csm3 (group 7 of RAMP superfamily)
MTKSFDSLDQTFDITPTEQPEVKPIRKPKPIIVSDKSEDREKDYTYARSQLYNIVEKMQESIDDAMNIAQQSEHPRAFEVVFQGAKHAADVVEKIGDLHKKMEALEKDKPQAQVSQVQNNMFLGSTADLMKMLKDNK